jgi:hypothetical protein
VGQRNDAATAADNAPATHLQRAFKVFQKMHPQPGGPRDLADWLAVEIASAYDYVKRLKELGCIERTGGTDARPLYGLTREALEGTASPPADGRGRWVRHAAVAWSGGRR